MKFENTIAFATQLDNEDPVKAFREKFYVPFIHKKDAIYFTGNSLGLQAKAVQEHILDELEDWASYGVEGHFYARNPWVSYHELFPPLLAPIVGAKEEELVVMNQLTVNLHLLMASFYRPTQQRYKIICEAKAFPSDQYAFDSQVKLHGFDPRNAVIEVTAAEGESSIGTERILNEIEKHGKETALVLFSGVNYYSGEVFDMESITKAAHTAGAYCGFDLAHAAGNIRLALHDWEVDFATWCSYKYLNSGPGGVSGVFIHEKHATEKSFPRLAGWWGQNKETRFTMGRHFDPIPTAEGWQLSNAPVLSMAAHKASLQIFEEAGFEHLLEKAAMLSSYLFFIIDEINASRKEKIIEIITPRDPEKHGCQVSMLMLKRGKEIFEKLKAESVIADWREPNVIRIAPVPLYNSYTEIFRFGEIISKLLSNG